MGDNKSLKVKKFKKIITNESVSSEFKNSLKENSGAFISSLIEIYSHDTSLQQCNSSDIITEALKAATLNLPVNKNLGFSWIIPRREKGTLKPVFQIGYKGYIQLALRTGMYRIINAGGVPKSFIVKHDLLRGTYEFIKPVNYDGKDDELEEYQGYFAHIELINGFSKTLYMTTEKMNTHAKSYAVGLGSSYSPWVTKYSLMAKKTMLTRILKKYGILSTEMVTALASEQEEIIDINNENINENSKQFTPNKAKSPNTPKKKDDQKPSDAEYEEVSFDVD